MSLEGGVFSLETEPAVELLGDQVRMLAHQAPREDRQPVEIAYPAEGFDDLDCFVVLVKYALGAVYAAVDMIDRTGNK